MTERMSSFLDLVYEAAFIPENWKAVLDHMARSIGAEGTVLFNTRAANTRWVASDGIMDLITRILQEGWTSRNPRAERLLATPHHGFQNEAEYFTVEEYGQYPIYTDLMQPNGYGFGAATAIHVPSGDNLVFSVEKKAVNGPVDRASIAYLDTLRPHLARAAFVAGRLEFERINAAIDALQLVGLPSATLSIDGRLLASNKLFEDFSLQIKHAAFDQIRFAHDSATRAFTDAMAHFRKPAGARQLSSRSFPLPRIDDAPPAIAHLVPVRGDARDIFASAACFLIVTPIDRSIVPSAETIQGLFDLTAAEARVARSLVAGSDVAATAAEFSVSASTVRSHVKAILLKSGMTRQADFVAAVSSMRPIN